MTLMPRIFLNESVGIQPNPCHPRPITLMAVQKLLPDEICVLSVQICVHLWQKSPYAIPSTSMIE